MNDDILSKLEKLNKKVERLNNERNKLLRSNQKLVEMIIEMDEFIDYNVRVGRLKRSHLTNKDYLDASSTLDLEEIEKQLVEIESMVEKLGKS